MATADRIAIESGQGGILVGAVLGQGSFTCKKGANLCGGDGVAVDVTVNALEKELQQVCLSPELCAMGPSPRDVLIDCVSESCQSCQTLQIKVRDFPERIEVDLGVNGGGRRVAVPEKVPDHLV